MTTYESIPELIRLNGIINWKIRKSKSDINSILFCSDKDKSIDANIEDMNKIFLVDFGNFYILDGTRSEAKNASTGRFYYEFTNLKPSDASTSAATPPQTTYVGAPSGFSQEELDRRIELATREIESKYKEKSLAEQKKDLDEERRDFYRDRDSALNVILTKIGAILPSILGGSQQAAPAIAVQGIAGTPQEERDVVIEPQEPKEEDGEVCTVEVDDRYIDAVRRWLEKDPEAGEILVKLVDIAYNNESLYNMAKNFLRGQGYV